MSSFRPINHCHNCTCSCFLGGNGEIASFAADAVSQSGAVRRDETAAERIDVELERRACYFTQRNK